MSVEPQPAHEEPVEAVMLRRLIAVMTLLHATPTHEKVLDAVVTGVRDVLGYQMAAIRILERDQRILHTAAVVGPADAVASMQGKSVPLAELATEFSWAERDGDVYFVPHEHLPEAVISTWVPDVPVPSDPEAWHPMDTLYVALNDHSGRLLGVLGVDLPRDGRRPGARERELLQLYARQAALALDRARLLDQQAALVDKLRDGQHQAASIAAALTHDLKTPLSVILSHAELALDEFSGPNCGSADERLDQRLRAIESAVARMTGVIDELLKSQKEPARAQPTHSLDLAEIAEEVVTVSRVVAQRRGLTLLLDIRGEASTLIGNRSRLLSAVDNLVANALKYTLTGGRITVIVEASINEVVLTCADDGVGIPADELDSIFVEYSRASYARAAGIEGTGLGLSHAHRVVVEHGGTLSVSSKPGAGTTFTVTLPRTT